METESTTFLQYLISGIAVFLIFSIIILIHEAGHFWAARLGKIEVKEFGFGLPPRLWGKKNKKSGVLYSINWIPFGGFVKMIGEDATSTSKNPHAFNNRPLWARIFTVSAGVLMNIFLAWFLFWIAFMAGLNPFILDKDNPLTGYDQSFVMSYEEAIERGVLEMDTRGAYVQQVEPGSPAEKAKILPGDIITSLDTMKITGGESFIETKKSHRLMGSAYHLGIMRYDDEGSKHLLTVQLVPDETGLFGVGITDRIAKINTVKFSPGQASLESSKTIYALMIATVKSLGAMVTHMATNFEIPDEVRGPVGTVEVIHDTVQTGRFMLVLEMMALISLSIGVLNIMPLPALDGGRLLFLLIEAVIRRPVPPKWEVPIHSFGFMLLMVFLLFITWNDIQALWFS